MSKFLLWRKLTAAQSFHLKIIGINGQSKINNVLSSKTFQPENVDAFENLSSSLVNDSTKKKKKKHQKPIEMKPLDDTLIVKIVSAYGKKIFCYFIKSQNLENKFEEDELRNYSCFLLLRKKVITED